MDEHTKRVGERQALFRRVNEQLEDLGEKFATLTDRMTVVCECGNQSCIEQIDLSPAEFEQVRSDPTLYVIRPGHEAGSVEAPVTKTDRYWVVRKRPGGPAELARELAPPGPR